MALEINIAIADDHAIFKQGIEAFLKFVPGMNLMIKASNGEELLKSIDKNQPDVVLLDLKMPVMDGLSTLPVLQCQYPKIKVIIFTLVEDDFTMNMAFKAGAFNYLGKTSDPNLLIKAIRECYKIAG